MFFDSKGNSSRETKNRKEKNNEKKAIVCAV